MIFSAVLDANALYPLLPPRYLPRLADLELCAPLRSERILQEMRRKLVERQITREQAERILTAERWPDQVGFASPRLITRESPHHSPGGFERSTSVSWFDRNHSQEGTMRHLKTWIFRYGLLAALVLAAGAGKKWGA